MIPKSVLTTLVMGIALSCGGCGIRDEGGFHVTGHIWGLDGLTFRDGGSTWLEFTDSDHVRLGVYLDGYVKQMGRTCQVYVNDYYYDKSPKRRLATKDEIHAIRSALIEYRDRWFTQERVDAIRAANKVFEKAMDYEETLTEETEIEAITVFLDNTGDA